MRAGKVLSSSCNPTVLLGFALVIVLGLQAWNTGRTQPQDDFWVIRAIGRLTATTSDVYSDQAQITLGTALQQQVAASDAGARERAAAAYWPTLQTISTPAMYAVLGYLQTSDFEFDSAVFEFISIASILLAVAWLCHRLAYPPGSALLVMAIILGANSAMFLDLWVGNFNAIQVGIIVAYLALRSGHPTVRRGLLAAILLGFAIALKPNLGLVAVFILGAILLERRWRDIVTQLAGLGIGGFLAIGLATLRFGSVQPWFGWLAVWKDLGFKDYLKMEWGNYSIVRWVWELSGSDTTRIVLVAMLGITAVAFLAGRRRIAGSALRAGWTLTDDHHWGREILLVCAAVPVTLLASPVTHQHYYLLLTPALIFLMRPAGLRFGGSGNVGLRQSSVVAAIVLISVWGVEVLRLQNPSVPYLLSYVGATALLFAVGIWELAMDRGSHEATSLSTGVA